MGGTISYRPSLLGLQLQLFALSTPAGHGPCLLYSLELDPDTSPLED